PFKARLEGLEDAIRERSRVPDPDHPLHAARGDSMSIRTECHAYHASRVAPEGEDFQSSRNVPQLDRPITTGSCQALAIRTERHTSDTRSVADQGVNHSAAGRVPNLHRVSCMILAAPRDILRSPIIDYNQRNALAVGTDGRGLSNARIQLKFLSMGIEIETGQSRIEVACDRIPDLCPLAKRLFSVRLRENTTAVSAEC